MDPKRSPVKVRKSIAKCPLYGISPLLLSNLFRLDIEAATAWKAQLRKNPTDAKAVAMLANQDLGAFDQRWCGFVMAKGVLWTPEDMPVQPGEIRALPYLHAQIAEYQKHQRWMVDTSIGEQRGVRDNEEAKNLLQQAIELLRQR